MVPGQHQVRMNMYIAQARGAIDPKEGMQYASSSGI
jgi:hypothetical protein